MTFQKNVLPLKHFGCAFSNKTRYTFFFFFFYINTSRFAFCGEQNSLLFGHRTCDVTLKFRIIVLQPSKVLHFSRFKCFEHIFIKMYRFVKLKHVGIIYVHDYKIRLDPFFNFSWEIKQHLHSSICCFSLSVALERYANDGNKLIYFVVSLCCFNLPCYSTKICALLL